MELSDVLKLLKYKSLKTIFQFILICLITDKCWGVHFEFELKTIISMNTIWFIIYSLEVWAFIYILIGMVLGIILKIPRYKARKLKKYRSIEDASKDPSITKLMNAIKFIHHQGPAYIAKNLHKADQFGTELFDILLITLQIGYLLNSIAIYIISGIYFILLFLANIIIGVLIDNEKEFVSVFNNVS